MIDRERDQLGLDQLAYDANGLVPAVVQQYDTGEVLMAAYMNRQSLAETIATGKTWFWSRSRRKYWMKGESSGNVQDVREIRYDCDADCLLVLVDQRGAACHTKQRSCFYRTLYVRPASGEPDDGETESLRADSESAEGVPLEEA